MNADLSQNNQSKSLDLEERTARFGESVLRFVLSLKKDDVSRVIISQLVRSATSIGANYSEANDAESRNDFKHKLSIARKESHETKHWLRMLSAIFSDQKQECRRLWQEATELNLIFSAAIRTINGIKQNGNSNNDQSI